MSSEDYHLRLVFDTNVLFGAIARPDGHLYNWVFDQHIKKQYTVFVSEAILLELQSKMEQKLHISRQDSITFLHNIRQACVMIQPTTMVSFKPDPDDAKILECALEARADCIYTADKKLLKLKEFKGIKILHPSSLKYTFYF